MTDRDDITVTELNRMTDFVCAYGEEEIQSAWSRILCRLLGIELDVIGPDPRSILEMLDTEGEA